MAKPHSEICSARGWSLLGGCLANLPTPTAINAKLQAILQASRKNYELNKECNAYRQTNPLYATLTAATTNTNLGHYLRVLRVVSLVRNVARE